MPVVLDNPSPTVTITTTDDLSLGDGAYSTAPSSAVWVSANRALFIPFSLYAPATAYSMVMMNGAAVSGNLDMGIYTEDGTRLASFGATAQVGLNRTQRFTFASPLNLAAGNYYMASVFNNATGQVFRRAWSANVGRIFAVYQQGTAFPLPARATFAINSSGFLPIMGVKFNSV